MTSIRKRSADPKQYELEGLVKWGNEGSKDHFTRRVFGQALKPVLQKVDPDRALDVGCGLGWWLEELASTSNQVVGIDPSAHSIGMAKSLVKKKNVTFQQVTLQAFCSKEPFDLITLVMVFEHLADATLAFKKLYSLLTPGGTVAVIFGDFNRRLMPRPGIISVEVEGDVSTGDVAIRTDFGERAGVIYDINRRPDIMISAAKKAGFKKVHERPILVPGWL